MRHWLMKSEPSVFGIDDLQRLKRDRWEGVRNYQVRNMMRDEMAVGDRAFLYHSSCEQPGIVGIMTIVKAAYPDVTAFDPASRYYDSKSDPSAPRWYAVDVKYTRKLKRVITLAELKACRELQDFALVRRGNRLSIVPVSDAQWRFILSLE